MKVFVAADFAGKFPVTCNNYINKQKRREFGANCKLKQHQQDGDFIVYYDEMNYNLYCKRSRGRFKWGTRASTVLPPSKGPNMQVQCAVSAELGLVCYRLERGVIKMDKNSAYVETIYECWMARTLRGKARFHRCDGMMLLRLGSYSPMLNPIESCFSVLKSRIKGYLAHHTALMFERGEYRTFLEHRMVLHEDVAHESMPCITQSLVILEALFSQENVDSHLMRKST
ncbi:hypothetical protein H257_08863 [Aphanomyces astaci]|uniref:Tc1-like transposase DDE domain-containing protein n=1 Tax=Aphanomyces astaci TaxID=112090 RepID=W4GDU6_APHAT|nr:hypothetical protein H257_08863 [Aphanomyces astaci]ETV77446.1 hypothetical protein H257_08863 [Aphanomyces astaci]|eukprot:XP_009833233.1 hypothetical protein H257_08863 [Aphanomyces astaci]